MSEISMLVAVTDNWLLELSSWLLDYDRGELAGRYPDFVARAINPEDQVTSRRRKVCEDHLLALLQLLDLIILHDKVVYDPGWAFTWKRTESLLAVDHLLLPKSLPQTTAAEADAELMTYGGDVVQNGALYYLRLATALGAPYWPAPARSRWLEERSSSQSGPFIVLQVEKLIQDTAKEFLEKALNPLKVELSQVSCLDFLGIGTLVLASSTSPSNVLQTALEIRNSRECIAFRKWLNELQAALEIGDIRKIGQGVAELRDVVEYVRRGLKIDKESFQKVEVQIGLAPSVAIPLGQGSLHDLIRKLRKPPYHIAFLRNYLQQVMTSVNARHHAARLFPEMWHRALGTL